MKIKGKTGDRVLELKAEGFNQSEIAKKISKEFKKEYTRGEVKYFLEEARHSAKNYYAKKGELEEARAEKYFNTIDKVNEMAKKLWDVFIPLLNSIKEFQTELKEKDISKDDVDKLTKLLNSLDKQTSSILKIIEHVDKITRKLKQGHNITFNINDISQKILKNATTFEKRFNVKFPKKRKMKEKMKSYVR